MMQTLRLIFRVPLFRLLAINLALGTAAAALLVGSLIAFNLYGLRDLIVADYSPATALGLLLFGLFVTFGSATMGTAIMTMGGLADGSGGGGRRRRVRVPASDKPAAVRVTAR